LEWARTNGHVVFTHDLDHGAIIAATQASAPSVLQLRSKDLLPDRLGSVVLAALHQYAELLEHGALVTIDPSRARAQILPFERK
jgi:predicted nuclease of predicted toxin-antitoxin system